MKVFVFQVDGLPHSLGYTERRGFYVRANVAGIRESMVLPVRKSSQCKRGVLSLILRSYLFGEGEMTMYISTAVIIDAEDETPESVEVLMDRIIKALGHLFVHEYHIEKTEHGNIFIKKVKK